MKLRSGIIASVAGAVTGPTTVTLGSTSGTPNQNICLAMITCTYVPFTNVGVPALTVPGDGTVTSFSVNSASAGDVAELRVLAPAGGGQYTGAGTSPAETLGLGPTTFTVSLPVKAGDVLALDNSDSALVFDAVGGTALAGYYELPSLADGTTAAPDRIQAGYQLLMSATVTLSPATSTSTSTSTTSGTPTQTVTTTQTVTVPALPPVLTRFAESQRTWRAGGKPAVAARRSPAPVGTVFSYQLNQAATATFSFVQRLAGRVVKGRCVAPRPSNAHHRACTRRRARGPLIESAHSGANRLTFQGRLSASRTLAAGGYSVSLQARNPSGLTSATRSLTFTIAK